MKFAPFTFQWANLHCVCRSMASASRSLQSAMTLLRDVSGRSFLVGFIYKLLLLSHEQFDRLRKIGLRHYFYPFDRGWLSERGAQTFRVKLRRCSISCRFPVRSSR